MLQEMLRHLSGIFRWWVIVAPWEQAVRVRLGKRVDVLHAGIHLRIPGVDRLYRQSTRRRFTIIPTLTVTTQDGKTVTAGGGVGYQIRDVGKLYDTLHHPEDVIQTEARGAVARFIASHSLADCKPSAIEADLSESLGLERYGLSDVVCYLTDFVAVKTYRLIQGEPKNWMTGDMLNTDVDDRLT